jgi:CPA2 family monovalent cation:H+ antiporter-2
MLGLEYSGEQLRANLRSGLPAGLMDLALNFPPGFAAGLLMGWSPMAATLLGGVTYISSSGVIAKLLADLGRMGNRETPAVISVLVLEDLAMAVYLPLVTVALAGQGPSAAIVSVSVALATVGAVLYLAIRHGNRLSRLMCHQSDEVLLFTTLGSVLLVAGVAQQLQVSSAVGAFLLGIALSGPIVERTHRLVGPLRDLFAASFFLFFALGIDPGILPPVLPAVAVLAVLTALTKLTGGWWAARRAGADLCGGLRAGAALVARGEFSIVIAGLGAESEPRLGGFAAAYVLMLAILGPVLARGIEPIGALVLARRARRRT